MRGRVVPMGDAWGVRARSEEALVSALREAGSEFVPRSEGGPAWIVPSDVHGTLALGTIIERFDLAAEHDVIAAVHRCRRAPGEYARMRGLRHACANEALVRSSLVVYVLGPERRGYSERLLRGLRLATACAPRALRESPDHWWLVGGRFAGLFGDPRHVADADALRVFPLSVYRMCEIPATMTPAAVVEEDGRWHDAITTGCEDDPAGWETAFAELCRRWGSRLCVSLDACL